MTTIVICSSASFYKQAVNVQAELEKLGFKVIIPATAERMKQSGDYDVAITKPGLVTPMIIIRKQL